MAETATDVREQAQEKAQQAQDVASKATDQARTQIDQRSTELGDRVGSTADDIRTIGQQLREQGKDQPAKLADQAAGHVERVGGWLRESDSNKLLSDVEDFGRRQPWALALGGLALGIAASRFLKASSTQRYRQRQQSGTQSLQSNGHASSFGSPASYGRDAESLEAANRTGIPRTSPSDPSRGFGTTPPLPSRGTPER